MERRKKGSRGTHEGPLHVPFQFDDAIRRVLKVKPPPEGWKEYERKRKAGERRASAGRRKGPKRAV